ncbi:DUF4118 domain-containing protein [Streptomyces sp. NPDC048254]|uniref:DUF4118 domain-containing protein n=1 Tax=Streptomyces sp. NPDC048254 TaxID=3365525 RepID=UPI003718FBC2
MSSTSAGMGHATFGWPVPVPTRNGAALAAGLALPFLVALVLVPFRTDLSHTNAALVLVVVVVAVAALGSRLAGAVAALSAAAWFARGGAAHEHSFLTRPYETFDISATVDIETAVLLLAVGLIVARLAAHARRLETVPVTDEGYLTRIHTTADLVRSAKSADAVVGHVRGELTGLLGLSGCRFEYGTLLGQPARLGKDGGITVGRRAWDLERGGWPEGEIELRAYGHGTTSAGSCSRRGPGRCLRGRRGWSR